MSLEYFERAVFYYVKSKMNRIKRFMNGNKSRGKTWIGYCR